MLYVLFRTNFFSSLLAAIAARYQNEKAEGAILWSKKGGSLSYLNNDDQFFRSCLFRGNKVYVKECGKGSASCSRGTSDTWQVYSFPNTNLFKIPYLKEGYMYLLRISALYYPNAEVLYMEDRVDTPGPSVPGKPINLNMSLHTGGGIHLIWNPPNDTGGVAVAELTKYKIQVALDRSMLH